MDPPLQISMIEFKRCHLINAFMIAFNHLISKITGDRTGYYRWVLKKYKKIEKEYDAAIAYAGPMDFITVFVLDKVKANLQRH